MCFPFSSSIDAYRSTRVKESTERPSVKKEDVSRRTAEEPRSQGHTSMKQKMKVNARQTGRIVERLPAKST